MLDVVAVIVDDCTVVMLAGFGDKDRDGAAVTVNEYVVVLVTPPPVAVIVIG